MKKTHLLLVVVILLSISSNSWSQNTIISDDQNHTTPAGGAVLDIYSTSKGVSIPNIALTGANDNTTISSPATGLLIYNTATAGTEPADVTPGFYYNSGTPSSPVWTKLLPGGNASGNIIIESDGTLILKGSATVWNDLQCNLASAKTTGTNDPTWGSFRNTTYAYKFNSGQTNQLNFIVQMPHDWAQTTIYPHIHWAPSTANTGNVTWKIEYTWVEYNSSTPQAFPTTSTLTLDSGNAATGTAYAHLIATNTSGITPSTSQDGISSILVMRLYREGGDGGDTYPDDAYGLSLDIHYEINSLGSHTEYSK